MTEIERQRVVVVRECLWKLTGEDFYAAAVLGQMLYWSLRTKDIDAYLEEEGERMAQEGDRANVEPTRGWVYKSAEELAGELLEICSRRTVGDRLRELVEAGWLEKRHNPKHKWDRTLQYRPNWRAIDEGLRELGYSLEDALPEGDWLVVRDHLPSSTSRQCIGDSRQSNGDSRQSNGDSRQSNGDSRQAIPETTTESKTENKETERAAAGPSVMCSLHNEPMKLRNKDGDTWYSHRLSNGEWCKGAQGDQPDKTNPRSKEYRRRYLEWATS